MTEALENGARFRGKRQVDIRRGSDDYKAGQTEMAHRLLDDLNAGDFDT